MNSTLLTIDQAVAVIRLNRPESLNALNMDLMNSLYANLRQVAADSSIRCVVLTGNGAGFSSGADLVGVQLPQADSDADMGAALREVFNPVINLIRTMPKPVVSAVNGVAAGAGMSIALAADIVLAGKSGSFLQAFSKIGLVPDAGSTWFLPRLVGDGRARALMMLADRITAHEALSFGMVWQVHEDADLMEKAQAMATKLANMPTQALALIKEAMYVSHSNSLSTQMDLEANLQNKAGHTADFREGVAAFVAKRRPQFQGK